MKAIALVSGGLDSSLSAKLIKEQGINVVALHFYLPFCFSQQKVQHNHHNHSLRQRIESLGLEYREIKLGDDFLDIVRKPRYGYGANVNPCIDCKILMLTKSRELMGGWDAKFIITGEVLGQRPMSQHRRALELIEKQSGLDGLILRPLSAQLLNATIPEREGWVDRKRLLNFSGRRRRPQMELAGILDIQDYPNPAGGCLLTDPEFSKKVRDLIEHAAFNLDNLELLKMGRHFRISKNSKLVVGRNEQENIELFRLSQPGDYLFMPDDSLAGPTALGRGEFSPELIRLSCSITSRYCDLNGSGIANIIFRAFPEKDKVIEVSPIQEGELGSFRI
ncbi:tRNA 4-thiouridine(8) synthase ThiI [bacterium]|nr:MAG: tRNA 4-thiouridine(8) synthase ThiI [bacterium]